MKYEVIIPAAGQGKRMNAGKNKLLLELNKIPIIIHTLNIFQKDESCMGIYIAASEEDIKTFQLLFATFSITKIKAIVKGGQERQHSVYEALKVCSDDHIIMVHDGARPFINRHIIHQLVLNANQFGSAIVAVPVKDTIKRVKDTFVESTLERSQLWSVQTPQAFQPDLLKRAHQLAFSNGFIGTDDASLVERMGEKVIVVEGNYENIKITTREDLIFAEAIIKNEE